jgi:hypothetical protein
MLAYAMSTKLSSYIALAAFFMAAAHAPASAKAGLGLFPIYPRSSPMKGSESVGMAIYVSHDPVATIDRWYRSKLPPACRHYVRTAQGISAVQYICGPWPSDVNVLDLAPRDGQVFITAQ